MSILIILVPLALVLGLLFITAFYWSLKNGQCDDLESPKHRMLIEEDNKWE